MLLSARPEGRRTGRLQVMEEDAVREGVVPVMRGRLGIRTALNLLC